MKILNIPYILVVALLATTLSYARIVTFNLLAFGKSAQVSVDGKNLVMKRMDNYSSVHTINAILPDGEMEYTYTVDGASEGFTRKLGEKTLATKIDFFGRAETINPMKGMGYPEDKPVWNRSIGKTSLFDESYIPTIIIDEGSRDFFISGNDTWTLGRVTFVLQDEVFSFTDVPTKAQNRYQDKFQFRIKIEGKVHKRRVFKFRANPADPTFIRQSIYGDVLQTIGNPVHNQVIVRVYLGDGTPIGLYLMIEVTSSKSFIKSQFYGDESTGKINAPEVLGIPLDCSTGADFRLNYSYSAFQYDEDNADENNDKIPPLVEAMHNVDVNSEEDVRKFSRVWFDLDIFFKALAMEYLTGHWDSYWMYTTNFVMYDDPLESTDSTYKFYFIDQDFDLTFGIGLSDKINLWGTEFPSQSYETLVDRTWNIEANDGPNREAIDLFLRGGVTKTMFENHLIDIVKHVFNPVALNRRIDEYVRKYRSEVEWDYGLERLHIATDPNRTRYVWSISDFDDNLESTSKNSVKWGLKQWIKMRAESISSEFNFEWDAVPLEPPVKNITSANNTVVNPNYNPVEKNAGNSKIYLTIDMSITLLIAVFSSIYFVYGLFL